MRISLTILRAYLIWQFAQQSTTSNFASRKHLTKDLSPDANPAGTSTRGTYLTHRTAVLSRIADLGARRSESPVSALSVECCTCTWSLLPALSRPSWTAQRTAALRLSTVLVAGEALRMIILNPSWFCTQQPLRSYSILNTFAMLEFLLRVGRGAGGVALLPA